MVTQISSSVGGLGGFQAGAYQSIGNLGSQPESIFDGLLSKTKETPSQSEAASTMASEGDKTAQASASKAPSNSSSSKENSEMDLNKDGQVTADEVVKYMQMQMMEKMSEEMSSDEGASLMGQQSNQSGGSSFDLSAFKTQQAAGAYQSGQNLLNSITNMISQGFSHSV